MLRLCRSIRLFALYQVLYRILWVIQVFRIWVNIGAKLGILVYDMKPNSAYSSFKSQNLCSFSYSPLLGCNWLSIINVNNE